MSEKWPSQLGINPPRLFHTLTVRGVVLLLFALFLITGPVPAHSDLFAAVLGYSLLAIVTIVSIATLLHGWLARSRLQFRITYNLAGGASSNRPTSQEPLDLFAKLSSANILPLFSLRITPNFAHHYPCRAWKVIGALTQNREFSQELFLPHRGYWKISHLDVSLQDTFGLSKFRWLVVSETLPHIAIYPKETFSRDLPIFTAETTSGVEQTELERTEGDPYDIKRYHPSDGIRRILWKVYAKSGELLSRHPEPSMTPEGIVALYTLAGKSDDALCSLAISFTKSLEDKDYEFLLCTDGQRTTDLATSSKEAEETFLTSVWDADEYSHEARSSAISALQNEFVNHRTSILRRITLFVSVSRLCVPTFYSEMEDLSKLLLERQLEPLWIIFDDRGESDAEKPEKFGLLSRLLFASDESNLRGGELSDPGETLTKFTAHCEAHNFPHIITK